MAAILKYDRQDAGCAKPCRVVQACLADAHAAGVAAGVNGGADPPPSQPASPADATGAAAPGVQPAYVASLAGALANAPFIRVAPAPGAAAAPAADSPAGAPGLKQQSRFPTYVMHLDLVRYAFRASALWFFQLVKTMSYQLVFMQGCCAVKCLLLLL